MPDKLEASDESRTTDADWRERLTLEQYRVAREGGTEPPFSGAHLHRKDDGTYTCVCCGAELFRSDAKFDSGSGWPSFWRPVSPEAVELRRDPSHGMDRTEVVCATCEAHLGHVFDDGPKPTGQRYCVNSVSLGFDPDRSPAKEP